MQFMPDTSARYSTLSTLNSLKAHKTKLLVIKGAPTQTFLFFKR